jgi:hypothetical protein
MILKLLFILQPCIPGSSRLEEKMTSNMSAMRKNVAEGCMVRFVFYYSYYIVYRYIYIYIYINSNNVNMNEIFFLVLIY